MAMKTAYRITSACLFFVAAGLAWFKEYDHGAYLMALAIYLRLLANE